MAILRTPAIRKTWQSICNVANVIALYIWSVSEDASELSFSLADTTGGKRLAIVALLSRQGSINHFAHPSPVRRKALPFDTGHDDDVRLTLTIIEGSDETHVAEIKIPKTAFL
ncbi:hypothetical protein CO657_35900 (plasmid) [Rhizobium acidisoli]|uniref:Uncharacterized protein n=1 Tax=Rhizobium acidisoli TaxID=1538158 RepID=A0AAE6C5U0_9HYPH|nr:hypothetical protein [Rhizobium acidisoli]KPH05071.1 hypothetical protein AOG23_29515 [Rhizobium acidisoli]QAS83159.1 hypothetical protein CO657_35900 [Rhizobium acidisoli]